MNLRKIDLNLLTVFDAILQAQNLSRAAENIGMSQPAVSDALARLRHLFQDDLFIRTGHGMKPTPKACHYGSQVSRILDLTKTLLTEEQDFDYGNSQRIFNLALGDYGEVVLLPRMMQWLESRQASINVNILPTHEPSKLDKLRKGELDIYLSSEPISHQDFDNYCVYQESLVSMVRADHKSIRNSLNMEQFLALSHIILDWPSKEGSLIEQRLRAKNLSRNCRMRVHSFFDMPRVVANTEMICTLPSRLAQQFAHSHNLKSFPIPLPDLDVPIYLSWHKNQAVDPAHRWLREVLKMFLRE